MPSIYFDMAAANAILKELYVDQVVEILVYRKNTFHAMVRKFTEFGGEYMPVPVVYGVSQGGGATFANAQANQTPVQAVKFLLTSKTDYAVATIDHRTLLAAKTDRMAFIETSKLHVDGAIRQITLSIASGEYRSGTGSIGQISTTVAPTAGGVIQMQNPGDVVQFEVNQVLQATPTDGGTPRATLGYVIAVDRTGGLTGNTTITVSNALGGTGTLPVGWASSDFLVRQGDLNAKPSGLLAWLPLTAPASTDNFYGVNRSADPVRLSGIRFDGTSGSVEEYLIDAAMLGGREGAELDHGFVTFEIFRGLVKSLGAKKQYVDVEGPADIGFRGVELEGPDGVINIFPDRNCPAFTFFLLQMNVWRLDSLNTAPFIARYADGIEMLRVYNQDAAELRVNAYLNLECRAPGWNVVGKSGI